MSLNKVLLIGNLTRDPELRSTPSGQSVANFSIATNRTWKDPQSGERKEAVEFHNIVMWRRLAEIAGQYLRKGSKIFLEGRLQTRSWQDQSGTKKYMTEVIAENMQMLDRKPQGSAPYQGAAQQFGQSKAPAQSAGQPAPSQPEEIPTIQIDDSQDEVKIEDIPF